MGIMQELDVGKGIIINYIRGSLTKVIIWSQNITRWLNG